MKPTERYKIHLFEVSKYVDAIVKYIDSGIKKAKNEKEVYDLYLIYQSIIIHLFNILPDVKKMFLLERITQIANQTLLVDDNEENNLTIN